MNFTFTILVWTAIFMALHAVARPFPRHVGLTSTLLLDGLGFQPKGDGEVSIYIESFAHVSEPKSSASLFGKFLNKIHADGLAKHIATAVERLKLFAAVGIPFDKLKLTIHGCDKKEVELPRTGFKDLGIVVATERVGKCTRPLLDASTHNSESVTIYSSPPHGKGVISDVDDTVKKTDVLRPDEMFANTAYKDPDPIAGMPEAYASLAKSLTTQSIPPLFIYLSGSPFELYPFLSAFLKKYFPASLGPLFLQSLSITDPEEIVKSMGDGKSGQGKIDYKIGRIQKIHELFPDKEFWVVGDSGEKDPEVYGLAFRKWGQNFIRCIWIHVLDDPKAKNSAERFEEAFKGVPADRIHKFRTSEIPNLQKIDVAGGKCN